MEFGVLGPLLVRDDSRALAVRAAKQRTLMAALLLSAGRVVSVDRLVDTLWDGTPPASAVPSLRNYVLRLRNCLGGAGRRIGFRGTGYVIELDENEVDLLRFARLRDEGTAAFERGEFALAARVLAQALGQWRGPVLVDVPSDALHREECPHLAESRLDVVELHLESEFRSAGRVPWSAQLRDLARAHPERERLCEHLITSLHAHGRRTEALDEYRRLECTLEQEYGVRPGERLRALHDRVREGAPAVADSAVAGTLIAVASPVAVSVTAAGSPAAVSATTATSAASAPASSPTPLDAPSAVVPFQIPAAPADFTGRADEVSQLVALLTGDAAGNGAPTAVSGQPGIGKTALALYVAHQVRGSFPGGVLYADLRASTGRPARPTDVLGAFLRACGHPARAVPAGLDERSALLRSLLAGRRTLLVLDDAGGSDQVRPLLPGPGACAALITGRTRFDELCGVAHVEPGPLTPEASARLLGSIAGPIRTAAEPGPTAAVTRACEGLPLAVRVAGTRLAARPGRSVRWLADRLTEAEPGALLDELGMGRLDVRAGVAGVYRRLDAEQARTFRTLAAAPSVRRSISVPDAAYLLGLDERPTELLLEQLVDRYLLASGRAGHYEFRPLTRAYGRGFARRSDSAASPRVGVRSQGPEGRPSAGYRVIAAG